MSSSQTAGTAKTAAVITIGLVALNLALGLFPDGDTGSDVVPVLSPTGGEAIMGVVAIVVLFLVLWGLVFLAQRLQSRKR